MCWELQTESHPVARKEYPCEASYWVAQSGCGEQEFTPEDWETVQRAKSENWRILPGTQYLKVHGKWEGEFATFRAREDMHHICLAYDLYGEC